MSVRPLTPEPGPNNAASSSGPTPADDALRASDESLHVALAAAGIGTWELDPGAGRLSFTAGSRDVFGLAPSHAVAYAGFLERIDARDRARVEGALRRALDPGGDGSYRAEYRWRGPGGEELWVSAAGQAEFAVRDGRASAVRMVGTVVDVTERRRAEQALRESEARYRLLHETLRDAFVQVDMDGRIIRCNDLYCQMLGYSPEEVRARTYKDLTPDRWHAFEERLVREQIVPHGYSEVYEKEYRRRDGTVFPVELRTILSRDEEGRPDGMWAVVRDITERKRAEEELRAADRQKTEFLAVLSHELRNPLAPMRNSIYVLDHAPEGSDSARRARAVLRRQADQLARLVDDLLDVTRISHGKIELQPALLDARDVVSRACEDARAGFDHRGVVLHYQDTAEPVWIEADAARVAQMVGNLLSNALKFTPPAGQVTVSVGRQGRDCRVAVRDTGTGIEPGDLQLIFEPFVQAGRTGEPRHGGLGIGLALVRDLATLHGGAVEARSSGAGTGAEFVLTLPLAAGPVAAGELERGAPPAEALAILVVEDNEDAASSLADLLSLGGHTVRTAASGVEGVHAALSQAPDVLLCDIGLPDLNGYEVVQAVRAAGSGVFAVALTGYAQPADRARALAAGFDEHLSKPPPVEELSSVLAKAARRKT